MLVYKLFCMFKLLQLFSTFLSVRRGFSVNTVSSYIFDVEGFLNYLYELRNIAPTHNDLSDLSLKDFRAWVLWRHENKYETSSTARAISALKTFFKFTRKDGILENVNILKLSSPKIPKTLPKPIAEDEIFEMMQNIDHTVSENDWKLKRNRAICYLIYSTGVRISEALSLNRKNFHSNQDFIRIFGKGKKERIVPLLKNTSKIIDDYLKSCPMSILPDYPLFIGSRRDKTGKPTRYSVRQFQRDVQNTREQLQMPSNTTPHSMRHSFASHIIKHGGDIRSVQKMLGHSTLSTTQKYLKVEVQTLEDSYNKLHPKGGACG